MLQLVENEHCPRHRAPGDRGLIIFTTNDRHINWNICLGSLRISKSTSVLSSSGRSYKVVQGIIIYIYGSGQG